MSNKSFKNFRFAFEYFCACIAYYFIKHLPLKVLKLFAAFCGLTIYVVPPFGKLIRANLKTVFPEKSFWEREMIARQSFANIVLTLLEFIWFFDNPDRMDKYMEVPQKVIDEVGRIKRETGRGVILVVPHLGNWEVAGLMFSRFVKEPFAVIARTLRNPYLNNFINSTRMLDGNEVIPAKGSVRGLIKVLKKGYSAATLIDQNTRVRDGGIFVDFFGLPVPVSRAPAMFARKMNIPVYVAGCTRDGKSYRSFMEPLPKKASDYSGETELIQDIIKINEKLIRKHPEQYLWFYKRFQYIPADAPASTAVAYPYYSSRASKRFYSKPEARAGNREN